MTPTNLLASAIKAAFVAYGYTPRVLNHTVGIPSVTVDCPGSHVEVSTYATVDGPQAHVTSAYLKSNPLAFAIASHIEAAGFAAQYSGSRSN